MRCLVRYKLKRPWPRPGGITYLTLQPIDFLGRHACLIPPPRTHLIRYHGLFSPSSLMRKRLPPPRPSGLSITRGVVHNELQRENHEMFQNHRASWQAQG